MSYCNFSSEMHGHSSPLPSPCPSLEASSPSVLSTVQQVHNNIVPCCSGHLVASSSSPSSFFSFPPHHLLTDCRVARCTCSSAAAASTSPEYHRHHEHHVHQSYDHSPMAVSSSSVKSSPSSLLSSEPIVSSTPSAFLPPLFASQHSSCSPVVRSSSSYSSSSSSAQSSSPSSSRLTTSPFSSSPARFHLTCESSLIPTAFVNAHASAPKSQPERPPASPSPRAFSTPPTFSQATSPSSSSSCSLLPSRPLSCSSSLLLSSSPLSPSSLSFSTSTSPFSAPLEPLDINVKLCNDNKRSKVHSGLASRKHTRTNNMQKSNLISMILSYTVCRSSCPSSPFSSPSPLLHSRVSVNKIAHRLSTWLVVSLIVSILLHLPSHIDACGPGRGGNRRRSPRKLAPLVYKQHVPNVRENTITASGFREGPIKRDGPRFKDLQPNYNSDICFKDEEGTGADRMGTRRLKEKLNTLAISVMNHWPGVRLRVTEGWDESNQHSIDSLHYEGRAVDLTTSDRDKRKYGMLARLAVEAGFDWVYYESRYFIHASVKSEKADPSRAGGCFDGSSTVITRSGQTKMSDLRVGDEVLTSDELTGETNFSPVLMFLDRDANRTHDFFTLVTRSGKSLTLTGSHLVYVREDAPNTSIETAAAAAGEEEADEDEERVTFARKVIPGQWVKTLDANTHRVTHDQVIDVIVESKTGAFAPLTETGNLLVNQVLASCYANVNDQSLAHASFWPVRVSSSISRFFYSLSPSSSSASSSRDPFTRRHYYSSSHALPDGIHWYPRLLKWLADQLLPASFID